MNEIEKRIERLIARSDANREELGNHLATLEAQSQWVDHGYLFYRQWSPVITSVSSVTSLFLAGRKKGAGSLLSKATAGVGAGLKLWNLWRQFRGGK